MRITKNVLSYEPDNYTTVSGFQKEIDNYHNEFVDALGEDYVTYCPLCNNISVGVQSLCTDCCIKTKRVVSLFTCGGKHCPCNPKNSSMAYDPKKHFGFVCKHEKKPIKGYAIRSVLGCILTPLYFLNGRLYNTRRSETLANIYHCMNNKQLTWFNCLNKCIACYHRGEFQFANAINEFLTTIKGKLKTTSLDTEHEYDNSESNVYVICMIF